MNQQFNNLRYKIETKDFFSLYTLSDVDSYDSGNYSCSVTNDFGMDSHWFMFTVTGMSNLEYFFNFQNLFCIFRYKYFTLALRFLAKMWR